jgi:uncharacterized protein (DUF2249 family)
MLAYHGRRTEDGCIVTKWDGDRAEPLPLRLDLCDHSPTGFEWGYGGSGPAQLSLALLADALGDAVAAMKLQEAFKWEVVAALPETAWQLSEHDVQEAAKRLTAAADDARG